MTSLLGKALIACTLLAACGDSTLTPPAPDSSALPADLTAAPQPDLPERADLAVPPDLLALPDLTTFDLAPSLDFSPALDLAPPPDFALPDLITPDLAQPDLASYIANCHDGIKDNFETGVDCGGGICLACAGGQACKVSLDCLTGVCNAGVCTASCIDGAIDGSESDIDCGGSCTLCTTWKKCSKAADCLDHVCSGGTCAAPTCMDKVRNGSETDVDCGGACAPCAVGAMCSVAKDCLSGGCFYRVCGPATCLDGKKDGNESDVDCGGSCMRCGGGKACGANGDCADFICTNNVCVAGSCNDGVRNQGESDIDCGGPCSGCPVGKGCNLPTDCGNGLVCPMNTCAVPPNCQAIKQARPASPDGAYQIDPDGAGGQAPFSATCDMTSDGGGWMLVTPAMVASEINVNCTVQSGADAKGGLAMQVWANQPGCGNPMQASHQVLLQDAIAWSRVRYTETFAGGTSCWGIFGNNAFVGGAAGNLVTFDPLLDTIRNAVRMGGSNGDAFDGVTTRCDNLAINFWHGQNGPAARSATVILRRKSAKQIAGLSTGTSCAQVGAGMTSPTWWKYSDVWVR